MNEANETLAIIRRQKAVYKRHLEEADSISKSIELKNKIDILTEEEERWLDVVMQNEELEIDKRIEEI